MILKLFRKHWPLWSILGVYWLAVLMIMTLALHMNQGRLAYVLDDAYIHLAMAKNIAFAGVWGVTGKAFTSTTSSPLWTGLFMLLVVCVIFAVRKRFVDALVMGIAGLLPVLAYGLASVRQGWFFLPNSVLLKGRLPDFSPEGVLRLLGYNALEQLKNNSVLLILCVGVLFCCVYGLLQGRGKPGFKEYAAIIYLGSLLLHVQFAQTGWFYRYEAYLVFVGGLLLGFYIEDLVWEFQRVGVLLKTGLGILVIALLAFVLAFPFADRALRALLTTSHAMNNIYEQQYQMGRFVQEYYEGESLALNDIGAVTYLADTRLLDLWGLASKDVARAKLDQTYGPGLIAELADQHGVRIAIVYDLFFDETGGLPANWDKVGEWRIRNNRVCASDVVAFYAVEPGAKADLIQNLRDFQVELPPDVEQSGEYLGSEGGL